MEESSKLAVNRWLAWTGPAFVVFATLTWGVMGHNIPPPNMMAMTGEQLVSEYYGKYPSIAPGMVASASVGYFYATWSALLASLLRDENGHLSALSLIELAGGLLTGWLFALCGMMWATCAVLVHQVDPGIIKAIHTMTWFIFDCTYGMTTIQMVALGLFTVLNKKQTMFPAWAGWTTIAIGLGFIPLVIMPFVTDGPFTVPGLWNFWIVFGAWLLLFFGVYNYYVLKHVYLSAEDQKKAAGLKA